MVSQAGRIILEVCKTFEIQQLYFFRLFKNEFIASINSFAPIDTASD